MVWDRKWLWNIIPCYSKTIFIHWIPRCSVLKISVKIPYFSEPVSYKEQTIINCLISELLSRWDGAHLQLKHVVMKSKQCYNRTGSSKTSVMVLEVVVLSEKYLDWCHSLQLIIFCVSNSSALILDDHCFRNNSRRIQNLQNFRNIAHQYFIILKKLLIGCGGWLEFTG